MARKEGVGIGGVYKPRLPLLETVSITSTAARKPWSAGRGIMSLRFTAFANVYHVSLLLLLIAWSNLVLIHPVTASKNLKRKMGNCCQVYLFALTTCSHSPSLSYLPLIDPTPQHRLVVRTVNFTSCLHL